MQISIILVTPSGRKSLAHVMQKLTAQTAPEAIEIIIVTTEQHKADHNWPTAPFGAVRVITGDTSTSARGRASGARAATTPITAFLEDHSFPADPDWAERVIATHAKHADAGIGPEMHNANPNSAVSWANLAIDYGSWLTLDQAHQSAELPGHNASYKTAALLAQGSNLAPRLEAEYVLQQALTQQGFALRLDPEIRICHINFSRLFPSLRMQHLNGQMFAASRAREWSRAKRLVYAAACPAIIALRMARITRQLWTAQARPLQTLRTLPATLLILTASGLGEGLGYAFGDMSRREALADLEFNRWTRLNTADKATFALLKSPA